MGYKFVGDVCRCIYVQLDLWVVLFECFEVLYQFFLVCFCRIRERICFFGDFLIGIEEYVIVFFDSNLVLKVG